MEKKEECSGGRIALGDTVPNFKAATTEGDIDFHEWCGEGWAMLFSHPADFTPVCTTELAEVAKLADTGFKKRNVKVAALSCDTVESHKAWIKDVEAFAGGCKVTYPIIGDPERKVAKLYGMLPKSGTLDDPKSGMPLTVRTVFLISNKKLKMCLTYPASCGRNFNEILRVIDSVQHTVYDKLATPVNGPTGSTGNKCVIAPCVKKEEADKVFSGYETVKLPSGKPYLRLTDKVPEKK